MSTKIPSCELTSREEIRLNAAFSQKELLEFCDDLFPERSFPLDSNYIHEPSVQGRSAYIGLAKRLTDTGRSRRIAGSAQKIGLSHVRLCDLKDIVQFVMERQAKGDGSDQVPPRMPNAVLIYANSNSHGYGSCSQGRKQKKRVQHDDDDGTDTDSIVPFRDCNHLYAATFDRVKSTSSIKASPSSFGR